jgi:hypothetical protein
MNMNNFEVNTTTDVKKEDPYVLWQFNEAKAKRYNIGELDYILYAINSDNEADFDRALKIAEKSYQSRQDLIADLFTNKGDYEKAKNIILNFEIKEESFYKLIAESFDRLIEKNPEMEKEILNELELKNKEFSNFLKLTYQM